MSGETKTFSDSIRAAVTRTGMSHRSISAKAGLTPSTLCRFMTGKRGLSIESLDRLCDAIGLQAVLASNGRGATHGR